MNTLATIGIETWRNNKRVLPGAKNEIVVNVQEFFNDEGPVLRVIYPRVKNQAIESMLNHFWQAIEIAGYCQSERKLFKLGSGIQATPTLILSEALASLIKDSTVTIGADPETVFATPQLKASWWGLIMKMLKK